MAETALSFEKEVKPVHKARASDEEFVIHDSLEAQVYTKDNIHSWSGLTTYRITHPAKRANMDSSYNIALSRLPPNSQTWTVPTT